RLYATSHDCAAPRALRAFPTRRSSDLAGVRDRLAATLACHSAVRAGQPLNGETMSSILRELGRTAHPTLCPHGRPTIVRPWGHKDRKSTRLNSSHGSISYAVFCLKQKT